MEFKLDTTAKVVSLTIGITTMATSIVYLIIWLVQLNVGFVANTNLIEQTRVELARQTEANQEVAGLMRDTANILTGLERRMVRVEAYIDHDDEEVQRVERKVDINERDIKNHLDSHDWSFE